MVTAKEEKLDQLARILQSRTLHGSESLRAFLRFVVEKEVDNKAGDLKEYIIATEVFGRGSKYDSKNDSVVRVQAGRLRTKLQEYYASEGKQDRVLIDLPKGHYSPVFSYNDAANGKAPRESSAAASKDRRLGVGWWQAAAVVGLFLCAMALGIFAFNYRSESERLRGSVTSPAGSRAARADDVIPVWGDLLNSPEPFLVTFSNTLFEGTAETGMKVLKPMDQPGAPPGASANPRLPGTGSPNGYAVTEHYTGVGEAMGIYYLSDLFSNAGHPFRVKRSLLLTWDDLKTENIIVLGSPAENLLMRDLPQEQEFVFRPVRDETQKTTLGVVNTKPKPGEQSVYLAKQEGPSRSQISEDYAVISLLRGLDERHRLLILAGITTYGTQAAAEYVTKPEHLKELITHLSVTPPGDPPRLPNFYQILVRVKVNGGVPVQISYVTHHVL
jgi:hypothetical protein